jgi:tetratricopeptide (TPR) repeat protein
MRQVIILAALLLASQLATAQGLNVAYLEGEAQVASGASWKALSLGDPVSTDASIRLLPGALIELKGTGADVTLTHPGTYALGTLLKARRTLGSPGVSSAIVSFLRQLAFPPAKNRADVLGLRGPNRSKSPENEWSESSAQVFLDAGKEYIKAGSYDRAIEQLNEALDAATDEEVPEIHYYLADASFLGGDVKGAWKQVASLKPAVAAPYYRDFLLLKAKLLEETSAYADALDLLAGEGAAFSQDAQRAPLYYFLLGLGYRGTGDSENANLAFRKVIAISAESDLGKTAGELLTQLP